MVELPPVSLQMRSVLGLPRGLVIVAVADRDEVRRLAREVSHGPHTRVHEFRPTDCAALHADSIVPETFAQQPLQQHRILLVVFVCQPRARSDGVAHAIHAHRLLVPHHPQHLGQRSRLWRHGLVVPHEIPARPEHDRRDPAGRRHAWCSHRPDRAHRHQLVEPEAQLVPLRLLEREPRLVQIRVPWPECHAAVAVGAIALDPKADAVALVPRLVVPHQLRVHREGDPGFGRQRDGQRTVADCGILGGRRERGVGGVERERRALLQGRNVVESLDGERLSERAAHRAGDEDSGSGEYAHGVCLLVSGFGLSDYSPPRAARPCPPMGRCARCVGEVRSRQFVTSTSNEE